MCVNIYMVRYITFTVHNLQNQGSIYVKKYL